MDKDTIIEVRKAKKIYRMGNEKIRAVDDVSFEIKKGEFCCLLGTSGSGKSTLLNLMAGIEKITSGDVYIKGKNIRTMSEKKLAKFRQNNLGFVFQSYNLLNSMTALENVELPLVFKRVRPKVRQKRAKEMLKLVGLGTRMRHKPKEMSGGQQQRVGIARAFVAKPDIVFADEPTGNLDTRTSFEVMGMIRDMAKMNNQTIVMVTHDPRLTDYADRIISILDGKIQSIEVRTPDEQALKTALERYDAEHAEAAQTPGAKTQTPNEKVQEPEIKTPDTQATEIQNVDTCATETTLCPQDEQKNSEKPALLAGAEASVPENPETK